MLKKTAAVDVWLLAKLGALDADYQCRHHTLTQHELSSAWGGSQAACIHHNINKVIRWSHSHEPLHGRFLVSTSKSPSFHAP